MNNQKNKIKSDYRYLKTAIALGYRNLGHTWPNPSVGCVVVKNNHIVGIGNTALKGRPHAEKIALDQAKNIVEEDVSFCKNKTLQRRK